MRETKKSGMYETSPLSAIFTTISMTLAEAVAKGVINEGQELAIIDRLDTLLKAVLAGEVIVWQKGDLKTMSYEEALELAEKQGVPIVDETGQVQPTSALQAIASPGKTLRIGGKK